MSRTVVEPLVVVLDAHCTECGREVPHLMCAVLDDAGVEIGLTPKPLPTTVWMKDFYDMPKDCATCGGVVIAATEPAGLAEREVFE